MQLIVFFNREKFHTLVETHGNEGFKQIYYTKAKDTVTGKERIKHFNSGDNETTIYIIYIDESGHAEAAPYEQEKAAQASILLIPDSTNIRYKPINKFIILRHNIDPKILNNLNENRPISIIRQNERTTDKGLKTLYYKLVKFIGNDESKSFVKFYNENFGNIESTLESALNFLHRCLNGKPQELPAILLNDVTKGLFEKLPNDITIQDEIVDDIIIKGYNSSLAELRDALLKNAGIKA